MRAEPPMVVRLFAREHAEARPDPVPARDAAELRVPTPRATRNLARTAPNAPLLIRIVRTPYALRPGGTRRLTLVEASEPTARVDAHAELHAALAERRRVRFNLRVAGRRPRVFAVRPSTWALLPAAPPEDA